MLLADIAAQEPLITASRHDQVRQLIYSIYSLSLTYCKVTNFRTVFIFVHFVLLKKYEI